MGTSKKILILILICVGLGLISSGIYLGYFTDMNTNESESKDIDVDVVVNPTPTPTSTPDDKEDDKENKNPKELVVDKYNNVSIICKYEGCKLVDYDNCSYGNYYLIEEGNEINVYDTTDNSPSKIVAEFKEPYKVYTINPCLDWCKVNKFSDGKVYLKVVNGDNKVAIYNLTDKKYTTEFIYDDIEMFVEYAIDARGPSTDLVIDGTSIVVKKGEKKGIVELATGNEITDIVYDDIINYVTEISDKKYEEYLKFKIDSVYKLYKVVNKKLEEVDLSNLFDSTYKVRSVLNGAAFIVSDDKYYLVDLKNNDKKEFDQVLPTDKIDLEYDYDNKNVYVFQRDEDDYEKGCFEYIYTPATKELEFKDKMGCGGIAKPVLYLYPKEKTDVTVSFAHSNLLTTTYPKFVNEWKVTANPNGDLYDKDGKYYYGLYWEETLVHPVSFDEGFYVTKDDAIKFLEEKLSYIGLNDRERNEFIMYWLPILEKNGKSLVYFELTEERESVNKINITPKPDSLLRIVMHVKKVDSKVNIKEEKLTKFNRKGFAAVEWGGHVY